MTILIESVDTNLTESTITENEKHEKEYYLSGIFLQAEVKNRNNRIYPSDVMEREVNKYIKEKIEQHRGMGELEHPEVERDSSINLRFVSHKIESLTREGNNWIGRAKIAHKQGMGALVANLMECGIVLGTSSRGAGSVRNSNGVSVIQNDFRLITPSDIVADPSAPDAIVTSLMEKTWIYENDILTQQDLSLLNKDINKIYAVKNLDDIKLQSAFNAIIHRVRG